MLELLCNLATIVHDSIISSEEVKEKVRIIRMIISPNHARHRGAMDLL